MRLYGAAFAAVATLAATTVSGASTCRLQQVGDLPLSLSNGRLFVEVEINNRPARLIVSTGATVTQLSRPGAAALDLKLRPISPVQLAQAYEVGAETDAAVARVGKFQLGELVARNLDLLVIGNQAPGDAKGILGLDILEQTDIEFDVPAGRLRFFKPKGCKGDDVVYWGKAYSSARMRGSDTDRRLRVTVEVNRVPLLAELNTGASHSAMAEWAAESAEVTPQADGVVSVADRVGGGPGTVRTYAGVFPTFVFGDETVRNARLEIGNPLEMGETVRLGSRPLEPDVDQPAMILGADFFRAHRVYVAPGQRTVFVSYVGGPVFRTRAAAASSAPPPAP
jgi:hypothetical protein